MKAKLYAAFGSAWGCVLVFLRSLWAHILAWKTWTKSKLDTFKMTLTVTGWQIVLVAMVSFVIVFTAYWTGRLHTITHSARSYAVSLLQPEPQPKMMPLALPQSLPKPQDPDVQLVAANAALELKLEQATKIANAWRDKALKAEDEVVNLKKMQPKPVVRYVRVREKSFVCDVFGACN